MYWENYDVRVRMDGKIDRVVLEDILKTSFLTVRGASFVVFNLAQDCS